MMTQQPKSMVDILNTVIELYPQFIGSVVPPLDARSAECVALHWTMSIAHASIDEPSALRFGMGLISAVTEQPWSSRRKDENVFNECMNRMGQAIVIGRMVATQMATPQTPPEIIQSLIVVGAAKAAIAEAGLDETDERLIDQITPRLVDFHRRAWPVVRAAGAPKPVAQFAKKEATGCLIPLIGFLGLAVGSACTIVTLVT